MKKVGFLERLVFSHFFANVLGFHLMTLKVKGLVFTGHALFLQFLFSYDTLQNITGLQNSILYDDYEVGISGGILR